MIIIASDHAGFDLKKKLMALNPEWSWHDLGPDNSQSVDYPDYAHLVCEKLRDIPEGFGVLICGSGQGMAMAANRHSHIRAALCWNETTAKLARCHNNANVLCLGSRMLSDLESQKIMQAFLTTQFEGGRHDKRVDKITPTK